MNNNNDNYWTRRKFMTASAIGAGLIVAPSFLVGCGGAIAPTPMATIGEVGGSDLYFARFGIDEKVLSNVLTAAMSKGGEFSDLFFQHKITNYLGLEDGEVNRAYSNVKLGCGVRVIKGDQTGFAFTEDLTLEALLSAAMTAAVVADGTAASPIIKARRISVPNYYKMEVPWSDVSIDKKIPLLEEANTRTIAFDKRIVKVRIYIGDSMSNIMVAASDGRIVQDMQPMTTAYVNCIAQDGDRREENRYSLGARRGFEFYTKEKIYELADTAAKRTMILFDAEQPPAGEYPVVLAPGLSGILLHEAIGHGMEADFNRKGISVYADKIGDKIAPEFVTIVDDGTNLGERGTINMDDEGMASQKTVLVENGVLRSYMHDRISAKHYKVEPTSNGRRESYMYPPIPRMRNTYMLNGPHDPEEIIRSVKKGIYAESFTNGQVQIGSGDFSFYLKNGYIIENGKLGRPIKDANLIGFGPKVLESVEMVGNDLALYVGTGMCGKDGQRVPVGMGLPTIKCGGISVGGA